MKEPFIITNDIILDSKYDQEFAEAFNICGNCTYKILKFIDPKNITFLKICLHGKSKTEEVMEPIWIYRGDKKSYKRIKSFSSDNQDRFEFYGELYKDPKMIDNLSKGDLIYFDCDLIYSSKILPHHLPGYTQRYYSDEGIIDCCSFW